MATLLDFADNYGILGVVGLIVCMGLFLLAKWLSNKLSDDLKSGMEKVGEKLTDQLSIQHNKLINTIVDQQERLVNHLLSKQSDATENHSNMLSERINLTEEINNELKDIMNIHNSQRAFIIEFHNSYKNLSGVPFAKYSCTFEWFEKGLQPLTTKLNALPFSMLSRVVADILNEPSGMKIYTDMEKMENENPSLFAACKDNKTKAIVYSSMYDRNNILIGLLILEYQVPLSEAHLNLDQLKVQTAELTSILNIRYKYSNNPV
jgi:small-conductance mechanosensitive channel